MTLNNKAKLGAEVAGLDFPPLDGFDYLIEHFLEVGPSQGGEALTFGELAAWSSLTGVRLDAWEATMLRRLSSAYLGEYHDAKDPARKPPYLPETDD